jgi:hypothetical protein
MNEKERLKKERERSARRRQTKATREYQREYQRAYYHKTKAAVTPEQKDRRRVRKKAWDEANRMTHVETRRERQRAYYAANKDKIKAKNKAWREANRDRMTALARRHREKDPERYRRYHQEHYRANKPRAIAQARVRKLARYGLTPLQFAQLLADQKGACAICQEPMKSPRVDHCHKSGAVRGLLCMQCNSGLGMFADNPAVLIRAADYLIKSSSGATSTTNSAQ